MSAPSSSCGPTLGAAAPGRHRPGILLADDAAIVRSTLGQALLQSGYFVWTAAEGRQAVDLFLQHHDDIDLVMLDVRMPGLDGVQTLQMMRACDPNVRCCFLTGGSSVEAEELLAAGAIEVLLKPIEPQDVVRTIQRLVPQPLT